jgi:hypothetical protein
VNNFCALDAGGKKAEAEGRGHELVEESEQPSPSVPVLAGATPSRAPNIIEMRTPSASLALGTGADLSSAKNLSMRRNLELLPLVSARNFCTIIHGVRGAVRGCRDGLIVVAILNCTTS